MEWGIFLVPPPSSGRAEGHLPPDCSFIIPCETAPQPSGIVTAWWRRQPFLQPARCTSLKLESHPALPRANTHPSVAAPCMSHDSPRHQYTSPWSLWFTNPLRHESLHSFIHSFHTNLKVPKCPPPVVTILSLFFPYLGTEHRHTPLSL